VIKLFVACVTGPRLTVLSKLRLMQVLRMVTTSVWSSEAGGASNRVDGGLVVIGNAT
jgi:hypothetical protein